MNSSVDKIISIRFIKLPESKSVLKRLSRLTLIKNTKHYLD